MSEGDGDGSGGATGVPPGALTALLQEVAATPEQHEAEPPSLPPGTVIGRFEILRELGRGGFGVVYEARDRDLGRQVAVKLVRPGRITEEEGKVSREAEAIARLSHPNLITLHEVGRSEHGPFLVFELLRGKTLDLRIEEGPLPVQEAVHIATEVARGLAHAHAEGVIHRDLKPANVFVTSKGQVKVLDFGMAHAFGRRRLSGGTPAYMAPEQWEDAPEDERTDVFALGVMLYRMLTGEYPFPEGQGKWSAEPATVRKLDVPGAPELAELVEKMFDPVPTRRPRDGAAVLAALTPIEEKLRARPADGTPPVHAKRRKATFGELLAELRRRHVFRVMIGYGVFAFAVLQVTEPIMHGADLPNWVLKAVLVGLVLGFPVAVILAWVYDLTAQGVKRTPSTTDPGAPRFGRSRLLLPLAVSAVVLAIATIGAGAWYAWKGASGGRHPGASVPVAGPDGRITVAVADFVNDTKDPELDGLSSQLITSLEQSQKLRVLTRSRMVDVLRQLGKATVLVVDEVMGREMARAAGVQALVVASIRRFDDLYAIDLKVLDPATSEYFFTLKEERAGKSSIPAMIDRLSERARERFRETPAEVTRAKIAVGDAITRNYEALQHYFEGLKHEDALRYQAAIAEYRKAAAADPEFALAHYRIAYLGEWSYVDLPEIRASMEAALRQVDRVPAKERLLFQAWKAHVENRNDVAHATYARAAEAFPQDKHVQFLAGELYLDQGRGPEAIPWLERAVALDPSWPEAQENLVDALRTSGRHEEAVQRARQRVERSPGTRSRLQLALALRSAGKVEEALEINRRVVAEDPAWFPTGRLAVALVMADRFEEAERLVRPHAVEGNENRVEAVVFLLSILTYQGRIREALGVHDFHARLPGAPYWFGPGMRWNVLSAGADRVAALRAADAVKTGAARLGEASSLVFWRLEIGDVRSAALEIPREGTADRALYDAIMKARGGDPAAALVDIRTLIDENPGRAGYSWWMATIALDSGRYQEGIAAVDQFDGAFWLIPWRAGATGRLLHRKALAQERLGDHAGARATTERLLARWTRADPDFPTVAEAKALCKRLGCRPADLLPRK